MKPLLLLALCLPLAAQPPQPVPIILYGGDYNSASVPTVQVDCFDQSQIGADLTMPPCLAYQVSRSTVSGGPYVPVVSCAADGFRDSPGSAPSPTPNAYFTPCLDNSAAWGATYFYVLTAGGVQSSEIAVPLPAASGVPLPPTNLQGVAK